MDIKTANLVDRDVTDIIFRYKPTALKVKNNGHSVKVEYESGSEIELAGARYYLAQFHFHTPSEHTLDGRHFDAEIHFVHLDEWAHIAVIGVFVAVDPAGLSNNALAQLLDNIPASKGTNDVPGGTIDATHLLPPTQQTYRYPGSLTTPGCAEGLRWSVMKTPILISAAQLAQLKAVIPNSNRPVQGLHGRTITVDTM